MLVQTKKLISMNYSSSKSIWKPWIWVRFIVWGLKVYMSEIYTSIPVWTQFQSETITKFTTTSRKSEFKDILPWNIFQMITKTIPINTIPIISYTIKRGIQFWVWRKVKQNWENNLIRISLRRETNYGTNGSTGRNE